MEKKTEFDDHILFSHIKSLSGTYVDLGAGY